MFSGKFSEYFQNTFSKDWLWRAKLLKFKFKLFFSQFHFCVVHSFFSEWFIHSYLMIPCHKTWIINTLHFQTIYSFVFVPRCNKSVSSGEFWRLLNFVYLSMLTESSHQWISRGLCIYWYLKPYVDSTLNGIYKLYLKWYLKRHLKMYQSVT